jgi:TonB family protein
MKKRSIRTIIVICLIVILLHLLLFLGLFLLQLQHEFSMPTIRMEDLLKYQQTPPTAQTPSEQQKKEDENRTEEKKEEWASLRPQASSFGAPVIMYDEPDDADLPQIEGAQQADDPDYSQNTTDHDSAEPESAPEEKPQAPTQAEQQAPESISTSLEQLIEKITPEHQAAAQNTSTDKPKPKPVRKRRPRRRKRPQNAQSGKNITLADITQGFLEQWKNKGPNLVRMHGNDNAAPTEEQIRYERYAARILWCLQNAWNIKLSELPRHVAVESELQICMVIDKNGKLENVSVMRSCGHSEVDRFIVGTIQYASSSFPPLPGFIKEVPFYMPWVIKLRLEKHGGPARFSMY